MPIPKFLANIFGIGASEIIATADKLIDNLSLSKEEKETFKAEFLKETNSHIEKMEGLSQAELETYIKDIADARQQNIRIQESEKASWWAKNIGFMLDISVSLIFYAMLIMIFFFDIPEKNKEIFYTAFGVLGAKYGSSFDFHRGSSASSKASGDVLRKMAANK